MDRGTMLALALLIMSACGHGAGTPGIDRVPLVATCDDVPPGEAMPEYGCFNVGEARELRFSEPEVYWHLRAFPDRGSAEAARSATGVVVEVEGRT